MNDLAECYRILDLEYGASLDEVKRSYRELVKVWHPDRFRGDLKLKAKAEEKLKQLNLAFERLCAESAYSATRTNPPPPNNMRSASDSVTPKSASSRPTKPNPPQSASEPRSPYSRASNSGRGGRIGQLMRQPWAKAVVVFVVGALTYGIFANKRNTLAPLDSDKVRQETAAVTEIDELPSLVKSAEQGDAESQFRLGLKYQKGDGVPKSPLKSSEWCRRAAEQGLVDAQYHLGLIYSLGAGVPIDKPESRRWYQKAAEGGHVEAQVKLGEIYSYGIDAPEDYQKSLLWFRKAADHGNEFAQVYVGMAYEFGKGVQVDHAKAAEWYQKAAAQGKGVGAENLEDLRIKNLLTPQVKSLAPSHLSGTAQKIDEANLRHLATDNRLDSGSILVDHLKQLSGKGELTLDNGLAEDACIKLVQDGRLRASFYVRSGEKFTYSTIPNGSYSVLYCTGYGWDAEARTFTRGRRASRYETPFEYWTRLKSDSAGTALLYDSVTLTLHKVPAGNAKTSNVDLDEFDRY